MNKKRNGIPVSKLFNKIRKDMKKPVKRKVHRLDMEDKIPGYAALHSWVRRRKPKPKLCVDCNISQPKDLANISGEYRRDVNDFEWLCRKCHMTKDGRVNSLISMGCHKGMEHGMAKLTDKQVLKIVEIRKTSRLPYKKIGMKFGISENQTHEICNGLAWNHVTGKRRPKK